MTVGMSEPGHSNVSAACRQKNLESKTTPFSQAPSETNVHPQDSSAWQQVRGPVVTPGVKQAGAEPASHICFPGPHSHPPGTPVELVGQTQDLPSAATAAGYGQVTLLNNPSLQKALHVLF